ncbi:AAR2 [Cordylochernes scorpioides]|uniref:Protein AAR2 homolog n=1 Tax=Cordylochernes scorpioides TaxID=51811 RepID=A0ABY6KTX9_9ARAC|nr:AAR2 [Cordylochernes scorpioides]
MKYYKDRTGVTLMECSMTYWLKVITALLIIGCIELNPGPKRQTTLTNLPHSTPDQAPMDDLKLLIIDLSAEVKRLVEKIDARLLNIEQKMEDWDRRMTGMETSIASCTDALTTNTRSISHNTLKIRNLEERAEALERRARENNLIIYGIESAETDCRELLLQKVKKLMAEDMQITDDVIIAECHRLGRGPKAPILIEVPDHESRISLLKTSSKLRILNIFMSRDYSPQIREQRKILIERRKELYKNGIRSKLRDNKLLLNGINYMVVEGQVVPWHQDDSPGFHFIYYGAVSSGGSTAPRSGFFHYFSERELVVKKWDPANEAISSSPVSEQEVERLRANLLGDLDRFLGPYEYGTWRQWQALTSYVSAEVAQNVQPEDGMIRSAPHLVASEQNQVPAGGVQREEHMLPSMEALPGTELRFTPIPSHWHPEGSTPQERSHHHLDSSHVLEQVLLPQIPGGWEGLMGELQVAFVSFLLGQVWAGFQQWRSLLQVLGRCDQALGRQLLVDLLSNLFTSLREHPDVPASLRQRASRFQASLSRSQGWDFESEPEDCQPVVVELPTS